MNLEQFNRLAKQGYNRIPLVCEVLADLDTPLSLYLKLANQPYSYLFESVHGGEQWGRYSIIGLPCQERIIIQGQDWRHYRGDQLIEQKKITDPFAEIAAFQSRFKVAELNGLPRFNGGLVGYFGYETVAYIEPKLAPKLDKPDPLHTPDILLMVSDQIVVFDNLSGKIYLILYADPNRGDDYQSTRQRIHELIHIMQTRCPEIQLNPSRQIDESDFNSGFSEPEFKRAVQTIKQYIVDGDCMQVVLSQRLSIPYHASPLDLYRALRVLNPSPYMYFLNLDDFYIAGSSPEILVRLENNQVTVRPIAGTRRRGHTEEEDQAMEKELLSDPKELAEHLMLIDLGRNDIGRVCRIGSVKLTDKMIIERYSHVMHIVSNVRGELADGLNALDVLKATFPAGTVSGAPKIRAMEIIAELEPVKRGIYSGAIGYLSWNGNMDTAIAIRTAVIKDGQLHIQAGAGIVADSIPELEWKETMNKGRAVFRAVALSEAGLQSPAC